MGIDLNRLRGLIRDAAWAAFTGVRVAHPDEDFNGFALYTDGGAMTALPAANSEQGYWRKVDLWGETDPAELAYLRWATVEWAYEAAGAAHFQAAHSLLNDPGGRRPGVPRLRRVVPRDPDRRASRPRRRGRRWEDRSARVLNPKPVYRRFVSWFEKPGPG